MSLKQMACFAGRGLFVCLALSFIEGKALVFSFNFLLKLFIDECWFVMTDVLQIAGIKLSYIKLFAGGEGAFSWCYDLKTVLVSLYILLEGGSGFLSLAT